MNEVASAFGYGHGRFAYDCPQIGPRPIRSAKLASAHHIGIGNGEQVLTASHVRIRPSSHLVAARLPRFRARFIAA